MEESLSGTSKTTMISNIGPADFNKSETKRTLMFAESVKQVTVKAGKSELGDNKDLI